MKANNEDKKSMFDKLNKSKDLKKFKSKLKKNGLFVKIVSGDGNCLFWSFADQLDGNPNEHKKYREAAVEYISAHSDDFKNYVDDGDLEKYLEKMKKDGTWGGQLEITALTKKFKCNAVVH